MNSKKEGSKKTSIKRTGKNPGINNIIQRITTGKEKRGSTSRNTRLSNVNSGVNIEHAVTGRNANLPMAELIKRTSKSKTTTTNPSIARLFTRNTSVHMG